MTKTLDDSTLEVIFFLFALFALLRLFFETKEHQKEKKVANFILIIIGIFLGIVSMTIGVGGSIILVPLLVGFLYVPLKKAISAGLFFVVFSSVAGFISHSIAGDIDYKNGITIGLASLVGVYIGVHFKDKIGAILQKRLLIVFYILVVLYLMQRIFFQ